MSFLPRDFVKKWLNKKGIIILPNGALKSPDGRDRPKVTAKLYQDYIEQVSAFNSLQEKGEKITRYARADVIEGLDDVIADAQEVLKAEAIAALKCANEDLTELRKFIRAVTGKESELDVAVMAHFIWQVKRKLMGMPVTWHMMPILVGAQGGGKSTVVNQFLLKPLIYYKMDFDLESMVDPRSTKALCEHYVCLFDEMQKAHRTDIDTLKNRITAETVDYRPMKTNDTVKIKQNCTFIGTSNKAVSLMIFDSSGMRRFYQLDCLNVVDWDSIWKIDYAALWRGVDEARAVEYIQPVMETLRSNQEEMRIEDDVEAFMRESGLAVVVGAPTDDVPASTIYLMYKDWCEDNGARTLSNILFSKKLVALGYKIRRTSREGKELKLVTVRKQEAAARHSFPVMGSA